MSMPEILAPAGSAEALTAALRCGADAVYLGTQSLNARRNAQGFTDADLPHAAELCHLHGAKLYLTLNILTSDEERQQVLSLLELCSAIGVDALIVQDAGVARLARACCDIPLHASTQMSVQTAAGAKALAEMGFVRMVTPREMSREELLQLRRQTDLELETFVHGALCMSVSGQCLMSAFFGCRSGNRGLCAQPCRLPFHVQGGTGHDLSLKDLSLLEFLPQMRDMGVNSFKIEGRMKRPEYVAAAVMACRCALTGEEAPEIFDALRRVFSRSGFTDGYYTARRGVSMFGTRQKEDVTAAAAALPTLQALYEKETAVHGVHFSFSCRVGEPVVLDAQTDAHCVRVTGDIPTPARNRAITPQEAAQQISKCGGTVFYAAQIDAQVDDGLFLPASALNALRRDALDHLAALYSRKRECSFNADVPAVSAHIPQGIKVVARFASEDQIPPDIQADGIVLPLYCGAQTIAQYGAMAEVPRGLFGRAEKIGSLLAQCRDCGVQSGAFASADGLELLRQAGLAPYAGFGSNVMNSDALESYASLGVAGALLSPEMTLRQAASLGGDIPRGVLAYGRVPLMLTRNCPQQNAKTCAQCGRKGMLTDRRGLLFPIECRSGCAEILNSRPIYLLDKQAQMRNLDFLLLYFTVESRAQCREILDAARSGVPPQGDFTRGLAFRGVE